MRFDDLDAAMRRFETEHDYVAPVGTYIVVRLDGRSFTKLTKKCLDFERPFDERMRFIMNETTQFLIEKGGFDIAYGFTQSDEISLLCKLNISTFGRKKRKYESVLAGEASAHFTWRLGGHGVFDARMCLLPGESDVVDYFRWRQEDAHRNALSSHCYWLLRRNGHSERKATSVLSGLGVGAKKTLLASYGVNFDALPAWQRHGTGFYWKDHIFEGEDPRTGAKTSVERRYLAVDSDLPIGIDYGAFIQDRIQEANT